MKADRPLSRVSGSASMRRNSSSSIETWTGLAGIVVSYHKNMWFLPTKTSHLRLSEGTGGAAAHAPARPPDEREASPVLGRLLLGRDHQLVGQVAKPFRMGSRRPGEVGTSSELRLAYAAPGAARRRPGRCGGDRRRSREALGGTGHRPGAGGRCARGGRPHRERIRRDLGHRPPRGPRAASRDPAGVEALGARAPPPIPEHWPLTILP